VNIVEREALQAEVDKARSPRAKANVIDNHPPGQRRRPLA